MVFNVVLLDPKWRRNPSLYVMPEERPLDNRYSDLGESSSHYEELLGKIT